MTCRESRTLLGANFCTGYIIAVFDRMSISREICPSPGASTEQAVAVGQQFIAAHPELWDRHPAYVLELAFKPAFACPDE
nr:Rap1a/Tai family immunity protein [Methylobacterium sp. GC_Met_2]